MVQFGFSQMALPISFLFCKLKQKYQVTYDSSTSCFGVHWGPNNYWYFTKSEQGLFYLDLAETSGTSFVTMVSDLEDLYSHCNVLKVCVQPRNSNELLVMLVPEPLSIFSSRTYYLVVISLLLTSSWQIIFMGWNWDH